jgi:TolA-binding protein
MLRSKAPWKTRAGLALVLAAAVALAPRWAWADAADDQYAVAAGLYARQQWKLAAKEFEDFLRQYPNHSHAFRSRFFLAETQLQLGAHEEAGKNFLEYLAREPQGPFARPALFRAGEAAFLAGKPDPAEVRLKDFLGKYPDDKLNAYVLPYLGDIALAKRDFAAAVQDYRQGLARFPDGQLQDDCRFGLARALEQQGQNEEALRLYLAVAAKTGSPLADNAQFRLGALQYATGKYAEAVETFKEFDAKFPQSPRRPTVRLSEGWALIKLKKLDEAKTLFSNLAADPKVGIEARYWLGMVQREQKQWPEAAKTLLAIAEADPKHELIPAVRFQAGDSLMRAGDAAGAQKQLDQAIAAGGEKNEWIDDAMRGKIQVALGTQDHALVDSATAEFLKRFPTSPLAADVTRMRGQSLVERRQHDEAVKILEPLAAKAGEDEQGLETRYLLALAYEGLKRHDDALAQLAPVLKSAPGPLKAAGQFAEATVRVGQKRFAEAVAPLEAFLASQPTGFERGQARAQLAICYARSNQLDKAKRLYAELAEAKPEKPAGPNDPPAAAIGGKLLAETTEQLAEAALAAGDSAWSSELFRRLSAAGGQADSEMKGLSGLGWSQFKGGQMAEAAATFDQLLKKNPPEAMAAEAALVRGRILEKLDQPDPALAMYDLVIDKYPKSSQWPEALLAAARLCGKLKQDQRAAKLYEQLVKAHPELPEMDKVLYEWAWVLNDLQRMDESAAVFERIHKDYPKSNYWADAVFRLAQRAFEGKDRPRAAALVAEILAAQPKPDLRQHALRLQGLAAADQGKWDDVRRTFELLVKDYPEGAFRLEADFWIAESVYRARDYKTASKLLDELNRKTQGRDEAWLSMVALRRAQVLGQLEKWDEAYSIASKIATQYPKFELMYEVDYLLGRCLAVQAKFDEAREAYKRAIRSPEGDKTETAAMAQLATGDSYYYQKSYEEALRAYLRVEVLYAFPELQAAALVEAGKCREFLGEWNEAIQLYEQVLKNYPNTIKAEEARKFLDVARQHAAGKPAKTEKE